eukprot:gene11986-2569_t
MGGLRGAIMFLQKEQNQPLDIKVQMDPFSGELGLGIYSYPMVYNGNAHDSCSSAQVGALISNGNLTEKHGPFTYKMAVTNTQLKAYGRDSILVKLPLEIKAPNLAELQLSGMPLYTIG